MREYMRRRRALRHVLINRDFSAIAGCRKRARSEQSVLSFSSNRFLIGELYLGKLSKTVVVHGNAPHDRPRFLVCHLVGNRASFLCTEAPMGRVPGKLSDHQLILTFVPWPKSWSLEKPSSLLIEHDGLIHFEERPLDRRLRQSVPLQYLIIERHQHFEL